MGFWHTGYLDHVSSEPIVWPAPRERKFLCQKCLKEFKTEIELRRHRLQDHTERMPVLLIKGREVGRRNFCIYEPLLDQTDVAIENSVNAKINDQEFDVKNVPSELVDKSASCAYRTINLSLYNADGLNRDFELILKIASEEDIKGVEKAVDRMINAVGRRKGKEANGHRKFTLEDIDAFAADCGGYDTAVDYYDGLCLYLYGALAKEEHPASGLKLGDYAGHYRKAEKQLRNFGRPLSNLVCGLIDFHFNHFLEAFSQVPTARVKNMAGMFHNLLHSTPIESRGLHSGQENFYEDLLADAHLIRILRLDGKLLSAEDVAGMQKDLANPKIPEYDKVKLQLLLVEFSGDLVDINEKREMAYSLRHKSVFRDWASSWLNHNQKG